jgi:ribosomal protein S18 acetylase RimI-like enzyme
MIGDTVMKLESPFRAATVGDCYAIAELFRIASEGVADYIWTRLTSEYPGLTPLEIGAKRYASDETPFSYKNTVVVERKGKVIGMMLTFPTAESDAESSISEPVNPEPETASSEPDVLAPYSLEAPGTWYICALAFFPEFRGQGLGTQLLSLAQAQAQEQGFQQVSLLCFEQNTRALKFYQRHGFKVIDRTPIVPHPLIHVTGDILLLTAPVNR